MYCYWAWYPVGQSGTTDADSHVPDREPVYVEVDLGSDEVVAVRYDRIHCKAGSTTSPPLYGDTHPTLRVIKPWHPYETMTDVGSTEPEFADMHNVYEPWIQNGWKVDQRSVVNLWALLRRGHWWPLGAAGFFVNNLMTDIGLTLGIGTPFTEM